MQVNDTINGLFELIGAFTVWGNVVAIYKDKCVKGVYWPTSLFFSLWGIWNLYYYYDLQQYMSYLGSIVMVLGNGTWVWFAIKYRKNEK